MRAKNAPTIEDAPPSGGESVQTTAAPAVASAAASTGTSDATSAGTPAATSAETPTATSTGTPNIDFEALKSLSDMGIDVSFLDDCKSKLQSGSQVEDTNQEQLDKAASEITNLSQIQDERLSKPPNSELSKVVTEAEQAAAAQVTNQLVALAKQVTPGEITDNDNVQKALGVGLVECEGISNAERVDKTLESCDNSDQPMETDALEHHIGIDKSPSAQMSSS